MKRNIIPNPVSKIQEIINEYPQLFDQAFSIDCGDGWAELVRFTCKYFKMHLDTQQEITEIKFAQIKEKFGLLRIYFDVHFHKDIKETGKLYDELNHFVYTIENISGLVCETCGVMKTAKTNVQIQTPGSYWKKTMCDKCFKKAEKVREARNKK